MPGPSSPPLSARAWRVMGRILSPLGLRMPIQRRLSRRMSPAWEGRYEVDVWANRRLLLDLGEPAGQGQSIYFSRVYERGTTAVVTALLGLGDWFVDVGANIGWFTTLAAGLVGPEGRVIAFEPHPVAYQDLNHNVSANNAANVHIQRKAVGSHEGIAEIVLTHGPIHGTRVRDTEEASSNSVPLVALDDALRNAFRLGERLRLVIKVDVEGFESEVLAGSQKLNQAAHPIWIIEASANSARRNGHTISEVFSTLLPAGYDRFYSIDMGRGKARLATPFVEVFRAGRGFVTRRLSIEQLDDEVSGLIENVLCLSSQAHPDAVALAERHTHWFSWLRD